MPISNQSLWDDYVNKNKDPYGGQCIIVAREVMNIIDTTNPEIINSSELISKADKSGITGFMAGEVASIVSSCHSRGEEFRKSWNKYYGIDDDKSNGGVVNPATLTIR